MTLSVDKVRPVTKVINLLKDMSAQIEKEKEKDEELFENFKCWCETYEKEKTAAIATANQNIDDLTAAIEEGTANRLSLRRTQRSYRERSQRKLKPWRRPQVLGQKKMQSSRRMSRTCLIPLHLWGVLSRL